jgi:hypothetical protein
MSCWLLIDDVFCSAINGDSNSPTYWNDERSTSEKCMNLLFLHPFPFTKSPYSLYPIHPQIFPSSRTALYI